MENLKKILYRSNRQPSIPLPFGARSVGHYDVTLSYNEKPIAKHFVQLFWGIEGQGEFIIEGKPKILSPQHVLLYLPGDEHNLRAKTERWRYRWLTMDGLMNAEIVNSFGLSRAPKWTGPCPEDLFMRLENDIQDITPHGERRACATAFAILSLASEKRPVATGQDSFVQECVLQMEKGYGEPTIGVESIARSIGIHRSLLCRLFKQRMGISPVEYLISTRIQKALSLLKETDMSVRAIAKSIGYSDPNYFSKAMKKMVGVSPRDFRR